MSNKPVEQLIQEKAYEIYQRRGGAPGDSHADWVQAEKEVAAELKKKAPAKAPEVKPLSAPKAEVKPATAPKAPEAKPAAAPAPVKKVAAAPAPVKKTVAKR